MLRAIIAFSLFYPILAWGQISESDVQSAKENAESAAKNDDLREILRNSLNRANEKHRELGPLIGVDNAKIFEKGAQVLGVEDEYAQQISTAPGELIIFVSASMPREMIKQYMVDAERYGGSIALKGFIDDSLQKTKAFVYELELEAEGGGGFNIDPKKFASFDVEIVPAIVLAGEELEPCLSEECEIDLPEYDKIAGSVSVKYALELFAQRGRFKGYASERLKR